MTIQLDNLVTKLILDKTGFETGVISANQQGKNLSSGLGATFKSIGLGGVASFMSVTGAIVGTIAALKASFKATMDYGDSVRSLAQANGITAESASRLIQVTDDYKLSVEDLTAAQRFLTKQGLSLTTETLADLSDQYLRLNTSVERQAFLIANFGRAGAKYNELMMQGGTAIRSASMAVSENLILTERQLTLQRQTEKAMDGVNDAWLGLKIVIGTFLIGPAKSVTDWLVKSLEGWGQLFIYLNRNKDSTNGFIGPMRNLAYETARAAGEVEGFIGPLRNLEYEARRAAEATAALTEQTSWELMFTSAEKATEKVTMSFDLLGEGIQALGLEGAKVWEQFLVNSGNISAPALVQFAKVQQVIGQIKAMIADGVEMNVIVRFITGAVDYLNASAGAGAIAPQVDREGYVYKGTVGGEGTSTYWWNEATQTAHIGTATGWATGGSFTVPPGFGNDSFPMRAQSGEQVSITPAGKPAEMDLSARSLDRLADMLTRAMAKML